MKAIIVAALFFALVEPCAAEGAKPDGEMTARERAAAFAVRHEIQSSHLEKKDICVGFGPRVEVGAKQVLAELKRMGLTVHPNPRCNNGPRGVKISIVGPIKESSPDAYEFVVELADLTGIQSGEHFATLLRRGTYVIECRDGAEPKLMEYRQTCCPETKNESPR